VLNLTVKAALPPVLIGGASLAGRRWGHHVGGWLVAFPLASGPVAFVLASDHGPAFAGRAAVGMPAGTISQVAVALAYRAVARRGWVVGLAAGCAAFAASTVGLACLHWSALPTVGLVAAALTAGHAVSRWQGRAAPTADVVSSPSRCCSPNYHVVRARRRGRRLQRTLLLDRS
jgi:hypothetical protein